MRFALSDEQRQLQSTLSKVLKDVAPLERVRQFAAADEPVAQDIWAALVDVGVSAILVPEALGGLGLGLLEAALVAEALGRSVAPAPYLGSAVLGPLALLKAGSEDQIRRLAPLMAKGEVHTGVALSETIAGARDGAGVRAAEGGLSGAALFIIDEAAADFLLVADLEGGLHLIPAGGPGVSREPLRTIDATRRVGAAQFHNADGETLARGPATLNALRDAAFVILAADMLGAAGAMIDQAVAYAAARRQFDRPIASFQAVKHLCAEMAAELEPARALVWYAAYALEEGLPDAPLAAAHAKAHLAEVTRFIARTATEVHGGVGFTDLLGLHFWFKRIGLDRQLLGGPERIRQIAAEMQGLV